MNRSRITGDLVSQNNIFVDIANDRVGIGSTIPGEKLSLPDSAKIALGNSEDLKIYHDGSHSYIDESGTGNLYIQSNHVNIDSKNGEQFINCIQDGAVQLYHDNSKKLETNSAGIDVDGSITANDIITAGALLHEGDTDTLVHFSAANTIELKTGGVSRLLVNNSGLNLQNGYLNSNGNRIILGDSSGANDDRLVFGNNNDLEIYHDGTQSYIKNATGNLDIITGSTSIDLQGNDGSETLAKFQPNGAVELYHNNGKRFETLNSGVQVTGTFAELIFNCLNGTGKQYKFRASGTNSTGFELVDVTLNQRAYLYHDSTYLSGVHHFHTAGTLRLAVEGSHVRLPNDNSRLRIGAGNDLDLYHTGSANHIDSNGSNPLAIRSDVFQVSTLNGTHVYINVPTDEQGVELYYDNVKRFETTSSGVTVTGSTTSTVSSHNTAMLTLTANMGSNNGRSLIISSPVTDSTHNPFRFQTSNAFEFQVDAARTLFIHESGQINLHHDGSTDAKLSTSSTGIDISGDLTLTDTTADSAAGPELKLYRNSASPADADYLGQIKFAGESDTSVERNYAKITGKILDASNGTEDGIIEFAHIKAGSQTITGRWRSDSLQLLNGTSLTVAGTAEVTGTSSLGNTVSIDTAQNEKLVLRGSSNPYIRFKQGTNDKAYIQWDSGNARFIFVNQASSEELQIGSGVNGLVFRAESANYTVWHSGNDGTGSGLDADLLDGFSLSASGGNSVVLATQSNGYLHLDNWIRVAQESGLFVSSGQHLFSGPNGSWKSWRNRSDDASNCGIGLESNQGTLRAWVYANSSGQVGFLRPDNEDWMFRVTNSGITKLGSNGYQFINGNNNRNLYFLSGNTTSSTDIGISGFNGASAWRFQLYGASSGYGFLDANWGNWDIKKAPSGNFEVDEGSGLQRVWNAGNDGSGSGLDADLLDGVQGSSYLRSDADDTMSEKLTFTQNGQTEFLKTPGNVTMHSVLSGDNALILRGLGQLRFQDGSDWNYNEWAGIKFVTSSDVLYIGGAASSHFTNNGGAANINVNFVGVNNNGLQKDGSTVWHAGNDGSGSGLDADTLDGLNSSSFCRTDTTFTFNASGNDINLDYDNVRNIVRIQKQGVEKFMLGAAGNEIKINTSNSGFLSFGTSLLPQNDNSVDLGSSSKRWANLYTADAHFSNVGTGGNDIDGTEGSWTLQEAEDNIYMINRKNGKRYKIKMEEV